MSEIKGNKGLITLIDTDLKKIQTPENIEKIFKQTCLFSCIKVLSKGALNLKVYKIASCAETFIIRLI